MLTVLEVIKKTAEYLASKGVDSSRLNAEILVGHALGMTRMKLYLQFERVLTETELEVIRPLVRRRSQREPLQYIVGYVDFSELRLIVDKRALIPRPETEYLIELIKQKFADNPPSRILDLGTGSGAIALALAKHFESANVTAIDISSDALSLARENARLTNLESRVRFIQSSWFESLNANEGFNLIVSNPPYLTVEFVNSAIPEVKTYEPHSALIAQDNGLSDIKIILKQASTYLLSGGLLAIESAENQNESIGYYASSIGLNQIEFKKDLTGRDRYLFCYL
jgi:release factor glutamine methyltransferase